jgi:hypothetical protein
MLVNMITESRIIQLLGMVLDDYDQNAAKTIGEIKLGRSKDIITFKENEIALDAFKCMDQKV